jgi:5-methylcytosine-specific restriction enzyme A
MAVLATLPEVDHALNPRRVWLKDSVSTFDAEYADLFPDEDPAVASEGRRSYRRHRVRERSPTLRRLKIQAVLADSGTLRCQACGFDFAERYGQLGEGFIECHHRVALADGDQRETTIDDLAVLCANCHRMIHRTRPIATVEEFRSQIR